VCLSLVTMKSKGLNEIDPPAGAFIQFSCAVNQTVRNNLFAKHLLRNIAQQNVDISDVFHDIARNVYRESNKRQRPFFMNGLYQHRKVYLNELIAPSEGKLSRSHIKCSTLGSSEPPENLVIRNRHIYEIEIEKVA
jgi:hypothetical protein